MEQINGYNGLYEIHLVGTLDGQPAVWSTRRQQYLKSRKNDRGYLAVILCHEGRRTAHYIHRLVAEHFIISEDHHSHVDHIDRNKLNNHVNNLRWVTNAENCQNTSVKGYSWHKRNKKWIAHITIDGKHIHGGYFKTEEEAAARYIELKIIHHPCFTHE